MTLAQTFQAEAMAHAQTAMLSHGAPTKRLFQNLQTHGGVETAKDLVIGIGTLMGSMHWPSADIWNSVWRL